jgi:MFS family permease
MSDVTLNSRAALPQGESESSGVSWAAVIAGALVASAFSLALITLGAGLGLVSVSPWSSNMSISTFGILAAAWFIAVQLFSSGLGGYLAGRLRTRWVRTHNDEVYFRDTAHGLLVWALGAVISAGLLASAASSIAGGAAQAGSSLIKGAAGSVVQMAGAADPTAYFSDMLLRSDHPPAQGDEAASHAEIGRIVARGVSSGDLSAPDKTYLAQLVASRTGLSQPDAEKRVNDVVAQAKSAAAQAADAAKTAADAARKTGIYVALWAFVSLLVGAFSASYMATLGGRVRDDLPTIG